MTDRPFHVRATDTATSARAGVLSTSHGEVATPVFMPVGTRATVKGLTPGLLLDTGASLVLANAYHLFLRPGTAIVEHAGGLHRFMGWRHPLLTDSGGFQIFSLSETFKVSDDGVEFRSIYDGSRHFWAPEDNVRVQQALGADIAMVLDVCPPYPAEEERVREAVRLSAQWAARCSASHDDDRQLLFGIVQGGVYPHLRAESAQRTAELDFAGYGIGGYSVGEPHELMLESLASVTEALPSDRPRYLMGVGNPTTVLRAIAAGVDMFDSVLPTRTARMGTAFSSTGRLNLRNAAYARDNGPLDPACSCPVCTGYPRSYLRHLVTSKEMLGSTLLSVHNLHFLLDLVGRARAAIEVGTYGQMLQEWLSGAGADDY